MRSPRMAGSLAACLAAPLLVAPAWAQSDIQITEFLASNQGSLLDEDGDDSDWIEIHNRGALAVDLDGWHLTDSPIDLDRWTFPQALLEAGDYLVVFASDKDRAVSGQELHTNFKLAAGGEYLALVQPDLQLASDFAPAYPEQSADRSYGSLEGSLTLGYFDPPTPGESNGSTFASLPRPLVSVPGGWQDMPRLVELSSSVAGAELRYTLDGSLPTAATGILYGNPIPVTGTTTLRARAFLAQHEPSPSLGVHYLYAADLLAQDQDAASARGFPADWVDKNGKSWTVFGGGRPGAWYGMYPEPLAGLGAQEAWEGLRSIPTVCVTMDAEDWFGTDPAGPLGIYSNSTLEGDNWVRAADMEWISPDGSSHRSGCGVAVQGGGSTQPFSRSQLSLSLRFQSQYGASKLEYPVFGEDALQEFDYLVLDAYLQYASNQRYGPGAHLLRENSQELRDAYATDLHRAMGRQDVQTRPVHLFLNGMYWGVFGLHERPDHRLAAATLGGDKSEYDYTKHGQIKSGNANPADHPTDPGAWAIANDIAAGGLAPGVTYQGQDAWTLFQDYVDVDSYIDYLILNFYLGNADWPSHNWISVGHGRQADGTPDPRPRFRFFSWDAEATLHGGGHGTLVGDSAWDRTDWTSTNPKFALFFHTALLQHPDYALRFGDRVWRHVSPGGALYVHPEDAAKGAPFDPAQPERNRPAALYASLAERLEPAIPFELARWVDYWPNNPPLTLADWHAERARLLNELLPVRSQVLIEQLRTGIQLYPHVDAPLANPRGGSVAQGTSVQLDTDPLSVTWYTLDGSDPRLETGGVAPGAKRTSGDVQLAGPGVQGLVRLRARSLMGTEWSPLERANFFVGTPPARLNELQAENRNGATDEFGETEDWCEISNPSNHPTDLSGWRLTDEPTEPGRFVFPEGTILGPKQKLVVWLDKDTHQGPLHADFQLSQGGESLQLLIPSAFGDLAIDSVSFPAQSTDHSWGRFPNSSGPWIQLIHPTPGAPNRAGSKDPR